MNCAEMCILFLCFAVPLIARVTVRIVSNSSLEVVTCPTTNGGRDALRYYVCELGDVKHYRALHMDAIISVGMLFVCQFVVCRLCVV